MAIVNVTLRIQYNANGGAYAPSTTITRIKAVESDLPKTLRAEVSTSQPTRDGFQFLGWSTSASATTASYIGGDVLTHTFSHWTGTDLSYNFYLYAVWSQKQYVVFYRAGTYGSGTDVSDTKYGGVDLTLRGRIFTRSGYNQTGWSTSANGNTYAYGLGGKYTANAGITLYPYWSIIKSTITSVTDSVPADGATQGTVAINRPNSDFTHTVTISLGTRSAEYTNVGTSLTFTIPTAWLDQIPNATSAVATVSLTTYKNGSQVGTPDTKSFVVAVPSSVVPTITLTGTNQSSNNTVSGWDVLVQGYSQIALAANAAAGSGATITSIAFSGEGVSQIGTGTTVTSELLTSAGSKTWTATVTDSRGRTATATLTRTVHEYYPTAILAFSAFRSTSEGNASPSGGQYITASGNYSFASCDGHNSASVKKIEYKIHTDTSWTQGEGSAASGTVYTFGTISLLYIYDVRLTVTDALGSSAAYTVNVASVRGVSFGLNGRCARFGGPVQYDDRFECDWDVQFDGQIEAPLFLQTGFVAADTVEAGTTKIIQVTFDTPFLTQPYVTFSMTSPQTTGMEQCTASSWNINQSGFTARLTNGSQYDRTLGICWIATARKDINVAIIDQPISLTVDDGDTVTFAVVAVNATKYQWYVGDGFDWTEISGDMAKTSSYTFEASASQSGYMYKCVASNNYGAVESGAATLTIRGVEPAGIVDITPYIKRESGGGLTIGNKMIDKIVGGTVAWNQQMRDMTSSYYMASGSATVSISDGVATVTPSARYGGIVASNNNLPANIDNHKMLAVASVLSESMHPFITLNGMNTRPSDFTPSQNWQTIYFLINADSTKSNGFRVRVNDASNFSAFYVKNCMVFDLTQMFGSTIADYIYSLEQATANAGVAWLRSLFPKDYYEYNAGELMSVNTSAHIMKDASENIVGSYQLDSSVTLRGIPKLDANNNLYYDGDEYESNGNVTRKYEYRSYVSGDESLDDAITDGTHTVVKLSTPTTETADPYTNPQAVDPHGTEEYVDYARSQGLRDVSIPVGHETKYKTPN